MGTSGKFELSSELIGCLPIVQHFLARMGVAECLERHLPDNDARLRLAPAVVIGAVVRNIVVSHRPVYAIGEWAAPYVPGLLGLGAGDALALNDDRVGRMLDRLFDADRATLVTETVLSVIRNFAVDVSQLHNDSTTVTFTGSYTSADGRARGGKATPAIRHGHNKDFRPDLKQLLFILTVSADGAVPIAYRATDGSTSDDLTHIPTWDELARLVGQPDFLYVADSKLCSSEAMGHIAARKGRFVTVVPHGRKEDTFFRDWAQAHAPAWQDAEHRKGDRIGDPDRVWRTFEAPVPSTDGYRVIWVHSSDKAARDSATRSARIEAGLAAIDALQSRIESPKSRLKTRVAVEQAATAALGEARAARYVEFSVSESTEVSFLQERRGRPGEATRYRKNEKRVFRVEAKLRAENVAYDAVLTDAAPLPGAGTVHHVAFASLPEDHEAWRELLTQAGAHATPIIDRFYFRSIYFREPSGVLFEIATIGPGFAVDEDEEHLGERLSLPPRFEPLREQLDSTLTPLPDPRLLHGQKGA